MAPAPQRILFLRPDAYGDLFLFEPVPRIIHHAWPHAEVAVLIREPYADAVPLLESEGVRWLTTACDPYRQGPGEQPAALDALRDTVHAFAPDCIVAACTEQTWLEAAVAAFLPQARQISLGQGLTDPLAREALEAVLPVDWAALYPERIPVDPEMPEWEKNLALAGALLGNEAPRWWPLATVPTPAGERAAQIVAGAGLAAGQFVVCAAAGTANVQIKSWPAVHYGETLAWLEREHGIPALLIGHESERPHLETVRAAARAAGGAEPALWTGRNGEMPVVAGLLAAARFYFGNDTGVLHLAAALGRPVVPVFGGGHWPRFRPVARRALTVVQPLPCFGCAWDCHFADAPCVRTISPDSVRRALGQFLADEADHQTIFEAEGLDAGARALIEAATPRLRFLQGDSAARLRQTKELTVLLRTSETDRAARQVQVGELTALLAVSEEDRAARQTQVGELTGLLAGTAADATSRLRQVGELTALLLTSETDRDARQAQVSELSELHKSAAADSAARLRQVGELTALLLTSETDRDARQAQVDELTALVQTIEADRGARAEQIEELTRLLTTSETDRSERGKQIETLTALVHASETDRAARGTQIEQLTAWLREIETDRAGHASETGESPTPALVDEVDPLDEPTGENEEPAGDGQTGGEEPDELELAATSKLTPPSTSGTPLPVLPGGTVRRHAEPEKIS